MGLGIRALEDLVSPDAAGSGLASAVRRRILLVGASGYVGRHVAADLGRRGHRVTAIDPRTNSAPDEPVDTVINVAGAGMSAESRGPTAVEMLDANAGVALWCVRVAAARGARVVHLGSFGETKQSPQIDAYRESKRLGSAVVRAASRMDGMDAVILRPSLIYGGGGLGVVDRMARTIAAGDPFRLREPQRRRDLICVRDVARAVARATEAPTALSDEIDIGSGVSTQLGVVADGLARRLSRPVGWVLDTGRSSRVDDDDVIETEPARRILGFETEVTLEEGLDAVAREALAEGMGGA